MRRTMRAVCEQGISWTAKALLVYLCERANKDGVSWAKPDTIWEDIGMSRPAYFRAKAELIGADLLAERPDLRTHALEVYPNVVNESQSETNESQSETNESQSETNESQSETAYRCINSSLNYPRTDHELPNEEEARRQRPKPLGPAFWQRFIGRCTAQRWGLSEKLAKHCAGSGLVVPMPEHSMLLEGARQALVMGHSEADLMQLADWIAGQGMAWHKAGVWRYVSRNFISELSKALCWDGKSQIEPQWPSARAPPPKRQDQLTTSRTSTTREIRGVEGLRELGINVPPGAIEHGPASEGDRGNDKPF